MTEPGGVVEPVSAAAVTRTSSWSEVRRRGQGARNGYKTFTGWHKTQSLYREIYARTVATLIAGFIAYVIAVVAGGADPKPLRLILFIVSVVATALASWSFISSLSRLNRMTNHVLSGEKWSGVVLVGHALLATGLTAGCLYIAIGSLQAYLDLPPEKLFGILGWWLLGVLVLSACLNVGARRLTRWIRTKKL